MIFHTSVDFCFKLHFDGNVFDMVQTHRIRNFWGNSITAELGVDLSWRDPKCFFGFFCCFSFKLVIKLMNKQIHSFFQVDLFPWICTVDIFGIQNFALIVSYLTITKKNIFFNYFKSSCHPLHFASPAMPWALPCGSFWSIMNLRGYTWGRALQCQPHWQTSQKFMAAKS